MRHLIRSLTLAEVLGLYRKREQARRMHGTVCFARFRLRDTCHLGNIIAQTIGSHKSLKINRLVYDEGEITKALRLMV